MAAASISASGILPPCAWAAASARLQPAIAPGTVEGSERAARGDRVETGLPVELRLRPAAGHARRHQGADAARGLMDEPEAVAAEPVHVRIDHRDHRRHGDHRLDRITALGQDRVPGRDRGRMGGGDGAAPVSGGVKIHGGPIEWMVCGL